MQKYNLILTAEQRQKLYHELYKGIIKLANTIEKCNVNFF